MEGDNKVFLGNGCYSACGDAFCRDWVYDSGGHRVRPFNVDMCLSGNEVNSGHYNIDKSAES